MRLLQVNRLLGPPGALRFLGFVLLVILSWINLTLPCVYAKGLTRRSVKSGSVGHDRALALEELKEKFEKHWGQHSTFSANFVQVTTGKEPGVNQKGWITLEPQPDSKKSPAPSLTQQKDSLLDMNREEIHGLVRVKRPDKVRWQSDPVGLSSTLQILRGNTMIFVRHNARHGGTVVDIYQSLKHTSDLRPLEFLSGAKSLDHLYFVTLLSQDRAAAFLRLSPKHGQGESFVIEIDKKTFVLKAIITEGFDTITRVTFSDFKFDAELAESTFDYKPTAEDIVNKHR